MENHLQNSPSRKPLKFVQAVIVVCGLMSGFIYFFNFKLHPYFAQFGFISKTSIQFYVFIFIILSALYFSSVYLVIKYRSHWEHSKGLVYLILVFAVIFRASLVPAEPSVLSRDMYRYIWDGRVQQNGINPYLHPPAANELKDLRDETVYPHINRKSYPTLYPAGSQLFFRLFHILAGDSVSGFKGLMTFFDVLTLFTLLALLKAHGFAKPRFIIYAWNPLVIFEIAYSGHLEGVTVFLMILAFYLNAANKKVLGMISLAISSATKLYPALLLPALLNPGERIKGILIFCVSIALLYLPFLSAGSKVLGFLPIYLQNPYESFNLGLKYVVMGLLPPLNYSLLSHVFLCALLAAGLVVLFKNKHKDQSVRYAYILTGLLIVLMPAALHAWYVILLIPFLSFYPTVAWLTFSCMVTLSYLFYVTPTRNMQIWTWVLEYIPLFTLLSGGYLLKRYAGKAGKITRLQARAHSHFLEHFK